MAKAWKQKALEIGKMLHDAARKHPELSPLCTSWMNFARKYNLQRQTNDAGALHLLLERYGLAIIPKQDVDRFQTTITNQADEIKALEYRVTTLLRPKP